MTPIEILMDEHRLIVQVLDCLEAAADRLDSGDDVSPDFFLSAAEFVAGFADRCHHAKEEDVLFVAMTARDMPQDSGPVAVMLQEHDEGRRYTDAFRSAAEQMKAGNGAAAADVVRNVFDYVNLLREHIHKEDMVLYPMAEQLLTEGEMQTVGQEFQRIIAGDQESGRLDRFRALARELEVFVNNDCRQPLRQLATKR
jgi:hemerythrin-like domain-containing protein